MMLNEFYKVLLETLRLTALPYEGQKKLLPDFAVVQDEVVNDFDNAFAILPDLVEADRLSLKAIATILRCFNMIETIRREVNMQDTEAIKDHFLWNEVRELARQALDHMGESHEPDLEYYNP